MISPSSTDRYFNITFMDAFSDNFAGLATRLTGGKGGTSWVVEPQWMGSAPAGVRVLRSSTNDVWVLGRIVVEGPIDLAAAKALQDQIKIKSLATTPPNAFGVKATSTDDPSNFLAVVNDMLARSPGGVGEERRRLDRHPDPARATNRAARRQLAARRGRRYADVFAGLSAQTRIAQPNLEDSSDP